MVGWRVVGGKPAAARYVLIAAPHTSNWDFVLMMLCGMVLGIWPAWVGKHTLFVPPLGWLARRARHSGGSRFATQHGRATGGSVCDA